MPVDVGRDPPSSVRVAGVRQSSRNSGSNTVQQEALVGRNANGTFGLGNPGKPRGARHRATAAAQTLLDGEAEALTRKAVEMALAGDTVALRLCLDRIAPRRIDAPITFDLPPMASAEDAAQGASALLAAVASGEVTPGEAASVMSLIEGYLRTLELTEVESRLRELEEVARGSA